MVADGSQPEYADELLDLYVRCAHETLDAIDDAARCNDASRLLRCVHTLKSSSASVGALALADMAERHEALLRGGATPNADGPARLRSEYARFEAAFERRRHSPGPESCQAS
jgi:HPt (histidine-containing phosphotransfer) domain-containing protein